MPNCRNRKAPGAAPFPNARFVYSIQMITNIKGIEEGQVDNQLLRESIISLFFNVLHKLIAI